MTTQKLPGTDAARHGTGDADLTIMLAAHQAFRRDLARLVRAAAAADLADPAKRQSVAAGWELFKRELHLHHTAEDELIWPVLRPRLATARTPCPCWTRWRRSMSASTRCWPRWTPRSRSATGRRRGGRRGRRRLPGRGPAGRRHRGPGQHGDRSSRARGAGRPAADRRGPDRLPNGAASASRSRARTACPTGARCSPGCWTAPAARTPPPPWATLPPPLRLLYQGRLEAPLQQDPALVSGPHAPRQRQQWSIDVVRAATMEHRCRGGAARRAVLLALGDVRRPHRASVAVGRRLGHA